MSAVPEAASPALPRLLLLTDRTQLPRGRALVDCVRECLATGLTHVVLRELDLPFGIRAELAAELAEAGARVVAAHVGLPGCVGVHLPAHADRGGAPYPLVGRSCHDAAGVRRAARAGATYCTLSPYAASLSKPGYGPSLPDDAFSGHGIPVLALGGITPANAGAAVAAGAHGVAVMGAVMRADDPAATVSRLLVEVGAARDSAARDGASRDGASRDGAA